MSTLTVPLSALRDSFDGIVPSVIATLDESGVPNVSYLSHVHFVDESHVALSNQFFSKTAANVRRLGAATLMVVDGRDGTQHILTIDFVRLFDEGSLFEAMAAHLEAASAFQGMGEIMKLRSADLYRVRDCRRVEAHLPIEPAPPVLRPRHSLSKAVGLAARIAACDESEALLDVTLDGLAADFGFMHAMILMAHSDTHTLGVIAHRGYPSGGFGAEVTIGDGLAGLCASSRYPIRISDLRRAQRYVSAVARSLKADPARYIPLPGLETPLCQMAAPMLSQGQLRGVIFVESPKAFDFRHEDAEALNLIAQQLATSLHLAEYQSQQTTTEPAQTPAIAAQTGAAFRLKFYPFDGSVFIDDDYLIKGVPGRLLYALIRAYADDGRTEFSNREIRRDASLKLPPYKDNLETRLILLRRRLMEKGGPIALARPERGQIRLEMTRTPAIEVIDGV